MVVIQGVRARGLLDLDEKFQKTMRTALFSREFRILLYVYETPGCSIKDAQAESGLSHRGFYLKIREMVDNDLIIVSNGEHDRRMRSLSVGRHGELFLRRVVEFAASDPITGSQVAGA